MILSITHSSVLLWADNYTKTTRNRTNGPGGQRRERAFVVAKMKQAGLGPP